MMTWKQIKEELESQGLQDDSFVLWIDIHNGEKLIVTINEHSIAEVSSY